MSDDHFLFALNAMFDVMILYDWVACIPTVWLLIDGLMARISCIRVQPQCSSISTVGQKTVLMFGCFGKIELE